MEKKGKYIDPTTDYGFKRIFGKDANNKELLISFINGLFRGRRMVKTIDYAENEHVGETEDVGTVVFGLLCTEQDKNTFVLEIPADQQQKPQKAHVGIRRKVYFRADTGWATRRVELRPEGDLRCRPHGRLSHAQREQRERCP